jgi:hypothetical protein
LTGWRPVNPFKYCRSAVICIYIRIIYIYLSLCVDMARQVQTWPIWDVWIWAVWDCPTTQPIPWQAMTSNDKLQSDPAIQQLSISSQPWTLHREASLRSISYLQPGAVCQRNILITYKLIT